MAEELQKELADLWKGEVDKFISHIESISETFHLVNVVLRATSISTNGRYTDFISTTKEKFDTEWNKKLPNEQFRKFKKLQKSQERSKIATKIVPRNFVVSLISQYDAYLGGLIRAMFYLKPELLNSSEKQISFSKLMEFNSVNEAKEHLIEKEVETVLRESHADQFKWLENKLNLKLTTDLSTWPKFIELTERRNIFVHNSGRVSSQYLAVCRQHNVHFDTPPKIGDIIDVSDAYFIEAYTWIFDIGIKLAQVIWRKLNPDNLMIADESIISISLELIQKKEYDLAISLLEFATNKIIKHSTHDHKLICIINKAQGYKWKGNETKCNAIINEIDWSAFSDKFKLASSVLLNDFEAAYKVMRRIGKNVEEVSPENYVDWPLFQEIRKQDGFKKVYKEIFDQEFELIEHNEEDIYDFAKEAMGAPEAGLSIAYDIKNKKTRKKK